MTEDPKQRRTEEWRTWFFFTFVMAPVLAVAVVGGFGLAVWLYQLFTGPPTYTEGPAQTRLVLRGGASPPEAQNTPRADAPSA